MKSLQLYSVSQARLGTGYQHGNDGAVKGDYMKINHKNQKMKNSLITNDHK